MYACMHACIYVCVCVCVYVCVCVCVCVWAYCYVCIHTHTHTHIHTLIAIDRPFIVLTETKSSYRHIPVWARYSPHRTRVEAHANTLSP